VSAVDTSNPAPNWLMSGTDAAYMGIKNAEPVIPVLYRDTSGATTRPECNERAHYWKTLKTMMPGTARLKFRQNGAVSAWFESAELDEDDSGEVEADEQTYSQPLSYKTSDQGTKTIYYWDDGTFHDQEQPGVEDTDLNAGSNNVSKGQLNNGDMTEEAGKRRRR
jgi:hypothetical protein